MLEYMIEDLPEYKSRGERIMSVLNGSGSVDVLPGRPDVQASDSDFRKGESYDPPLDFDPNSFSRIDKFDGVGKWTRARREHLDAPIENPKPYQSSFSGLAFKDERCRSR